MAADDWIYLTEKESERCWDMTPVLFDSFEQAKQAMNYYSTKFKDYYFKVVEYEDY